ncbi:YihY family inner membrane protein [Wolinella succinogenes]|nr:YihY family inner membrane protein [Wolinella succinogenes]HCZ18771.1 YihY family inner membrane protein [Helicobacter sp.]
MDRQRVRFWKERLARLWTFFDAELSFYAASLSFYTIFALIPLLLIVFSLLANLPNFQDQLLELKGFLLSNLMPTNTEVVSLYLDRFMENSSKLGNMGLVYVLIASLLFFKNYQYIVAKMFNSKPRDFWSSVTVYWTLMTLLPIGLSLSIFFSTQAQMILEESGYHRLDPGVSGIVPAFLVWVMLFVLFKISANKPLTLRASLLSSLLTALVWLFSKWAFVFYVFHNKAYLTLYGSFSILLFFLLWVYLSWAILLYGMRLCEALNSGLGEESSPG